MPRWRDFFSARQLLVHGTFVEEFRRLVPEVRAALDGEGGVGVLALLALMQGKAVNWNSILSTWDASRDKMRSVFERHDFAFKWTFAEFDGARELYPWCLSQIVDAYKGIAELLQPSDVGTLGTTPAIQVPGSVTVTHGNAGHLPSVADRSVSQAGV